jgi:hypothetical protein
MRSIVRTVRAVVTECNDATRRLTEAVADPERYVIEQDQAPDTFQMFLIRATGTRIHEPSALGRSLGLTVR